MNSPTNPYIAGNPITGTEMFFGRQDVFRFVQETLVGRYQDNAIVLYGGRRTGKTTVLYQMSRHLDPRYVPVFVDLQGISLQGLGEMLWGIARQIARTLRRQKGIRLNVPSRDEFADDPGGCFRDGFLDPALEALGDDHLLLMLDEATRLYEQVQAGHLEPRVFDLLRSLIQHYPRLNFICSIGSGLEEMRREYTVLFNVCQYRKISFLDRDAGVALITEPVKEHYRYAPGAMERILEVTHGHPYYTQLVCNRLFARWARQGGDEVAVSDVEAVLSEAAEQGMASLQYTWEEASDTAKVVLAALAELVVDANQPVSPGDLRTTLAAQEIALSRRAVNGALRELVTREVLRPANSGYVFTVDLMRLWLQQYQRLEWVKSIIPLPEEAISPAGRDWVRLILVGVSAGLLLLLIGLSVTVWRSTKQARLETQSTATAVSGTISALETAIARGAGSDAQAQLAVMQTKSAEMQATQQILIDTLGPISTAMSPDYENTGTIPIAYTASDDKSGIATVVLWSKFGAGDMWTDTGQFSTGTTGTFAFTPTHGDGTYYFQTIAMDKAGNVENGPSGDGDDYTIYDTTDPTSEATSPDYANAVPISVTYVANDNVSGIDIVALWYKFGVSGTWTDSGQRLIGASGTFVFHPPYGDGMYCFQTIAMDKVGNVENGPSGDGDGCTIYDTTPPTSAATLSDYANASSTHSHRLF